MSEENINRIEREDGTTVEIEFFDPNDPAPSLVPLDDYEFEPNPLPVIEKAGGVKFRRLGTWVKREP